VRNLGENARLAVFEYGEFGCFVNPSIQFFDDSDAPAFIQDAPVIRHHAFRQFGWEKVIHRLPKQVLEGHSKHLLVVPAQTQGANIPVFEEDVNRAMLEEGGKDRFVFLQCLLRLFAFGNVDKSPNHSRNFAMRIAKNILCKDDGPEHPIPVPDFEIIRLVTRIRHQFHVFAVINMSQFAGPEIVNRFSLNFPCSHAQDFGKSPVASQVLPLPILVENGSGNCIEKRVGEIDIPLEFLFRPFAFADVPIDGIRPNHMLVDDNGITHQRHIHRAPVFRAAESLFLHNLPAAKDILRNTLGVLQIRFGSQQSVDVPSARLGFGIAKKAFKGPVRLQNNVFMVEDGNRFRGTLEQVTEHQHLAGKFFLRLPVRSHIAYHARQPSSILVDRSRYFQNPVFVVDLEGLNFASLHQRRDNGDDLRGVFCRQQIAGQGYDIPANKFPAGDFQDAFEGTVDCQHLPVQRGIGNSHRNGFEYIGKVRLAPHTQPLTCIRLCSVDKASPLTPDQRQPQTRRQHPKTGNQQDLPICRIFAPQENTASGNSQRQE